MTAKIVDWGEGVKVSTRPNLVNYMHAYGIGKCAFCSSFETSDRNWTKKIIILQKLINIGFGDLNGSMYNYQYIYHCAIIAKKQSLVYVRLNVYPMFEPEIVCEILK